MARSQDPGSGFLFEPAAPARRGDGEPRPDAPLADRVRPRTLDELLGQEEALGPDTPLRRAIDSDNLRSLILWGPPGSGRR
jgi:putative ATPase